MKIENQYIVQAVTIAANNLRLSSEKIEVVSLLRKHLSECEDLYLVITEMKKITELSKLGIKLGQIYQYIASKQIDFLEISEKFKEHSHSLVLELSHMLDRVAPTTFNQIINKTKPLIDSEPEIIDTTKLVSAFDKIEMPVSNNIQVVQEKEDVESDNDDIMVKPLEKEVSDTVTEKEEFIFDEIRDKDEDEFDFEDYEAKILAPIKELEAILKRIDARDHSDEELEKYIDIMLENADLSSKIGFDIISNMHKIVAFTFRRIVSKKISINNDTIEGIRACLIVIVAVVRGKEVDISSYLKKAETFGNYITSIK